MNEPTVGQAVLYYPSTGDNVRYPPGQPLPAIITSVEEDERVSLSILDMKGTAFSRTGVRAGKAGMDGAYAEWRGQDSAGKVSFKPEPELEPRDEPGMVERSPQFSESKKPGPPLRPGPAHPGTPSPGSSAKEVR